MSRLLYPPLEPDWTDLVSVGDGHKLYVETCGNPDGWPVLVVHGGPGAGCTPDQRRFFNPDRYRIILFDQRGAGRSRPLASIEQNTTAHLIADMELLRRHLNVGRWLLFGGSWGSTLSLAYARTHPERCHALILRGVWLARREDLSWQFGSLKMVYPDHWASFISHIPEAERDDLIEAYYRRLTDPDPAVHMPAASAWRLYEKRCATLLPYNGSAGPLDERLLAVSRIEAHYFRAGAFLGDAPLLGAASHLHSIPGVIVHGRYDMLCPLAGAAALSAVWRSAEFHIVTDAGHSAFEPGIKSRLLEVTDRFADGKVWK